MHATLSRKEPDVPQDPNVVPPGQNLTELLAKLANASPAASRPSGSAQIDFSAGPRVTAPSLDIAARALDNVRPSRQLKSHVRRGMRGSMRYLLAVSIGVAVTLAWQSYGEVGNHMIATFIAQRGLLSSLHMLQPSPRDLNREPSAAAVQPNTADAAATGPAALAEAAPHLVVPQATAVAPAAPTSAEFTQQIETIVHDITALRQNMEELINAQSQIARTLAAMRAAEDARHAQPASPSRPAVTRKRGDARAPQQRLPQLAPGPRPLSQSFEPSPPPPPPQPPRPPASMP